MHIAFAINNFYSYGTERSTATIMRGLAERGHRIDFVLHSLHIHQPQWIPESVRLFVCNDNPDEQTLAHPDYANLRKRITFITPQKSGWRERIYLARKLQGHLPGKGRINRALTFAHYLREQQPDIVLPQLLDFSLRVLTTRYFLDNPPPIVPIIRIVTLPPESRSEAKYRALCCYAKRIVTVSDGAVDTLLRETSATKQQVTTIYNPIVTRELAALAAKPPQHKWFTDGGAPVILGCGRLTEQKDFPTLIDAFAQVAAQRNCRLVIAGEGELRESLQAQIDKLGLQDKVSLPGWVANPLALMANASLFVLSSLYEGFGRVLAEALACGCPSVSTDCPAGPDEILQSGKIGELVPVGDAGALAKAMIRTLDNPPDKQKLLNRAADFTEEIAVDKYERMIGEVVASANVKF